MATVSFPPFSPVALDNLRERNTIIVSDLLPFITGALQPHRVAMGTASAVFFLA